MRSQNQPNIFVIGTGSTGKTTLVMALQDHYANHADTRHNPGPVVIQEVARDVIRELGIDRDLMVDSTQKCLELQSAILRAQHDAEMALRIAQTAYISDRSGLDPTAYTELLVDKEASSQLLRSHEWRVLEENMRTGLVFLCEAGCTWLEDDGLRLMPKDEEDWHRFDRVFCNLLDARDIAYHVVLRDMTVEDRVSFVLEGVRRWRARV